jgi:hypothetical protein
MIQCKHYPAGAFSTLKSAVTREAAKLSSPDVPPTNTYRLVTSHGLTPGNKTTLATILSPRVTCDNEIFGCDDLEGILDAHAEIERRHIKLWLASSAQLAAYLSSGVHTRSRVLAAEIDQALPRYVQGKAFFEAKQRLIDEHVCIIAGEPGIGKTTLAHMLVADAIARDYEPIDIGASVDEAWDVFDPSTPQAFLYDDFLGRTVLGELEKNEESRLLSLMRAVAKSGNSLFILTTREYILHKAVQLREALAHGGLDQRKFVLELPSYSRLDRARILYNHVWHSQHISSGAKQVLASDRKYLKIVDHKNFNPRLIEYVTGFQTGHLPPDGDGDAWFDFAVTALDHPAEIWRTAFEQGLGDAERALLLVATTFGGEIELGDLQEGFDSWCSEAGIPLRPRRFESALSVVDDTFLRTRRTDDGHFFVRVWNPGLTDFLKAELMSEAGLVTTAWNSLVFFEQFEMLTEFANRDGSSGRKPDPTPAVEAAKRLLHSDRGEWQIHRTEAGSERAYRRSPAVEARILFLMERNQGVVRAADEWLEVETRNVVELWSLGRGDAESALGLARFWMHDETASTAPEDWLANLKRLLSSSLRETYEWELVVELQESWPSAYGETEWQDLRDRFEAFVGEELDHQGEYGTSDDDLGRLERCAVALEVPIDGQHFDRAARAIQQRMDEVGAAEDYAADEALDRWKMEERPRERAEEAAIDELFSRLNDQP